LLSRGIRQHDDSGFVVLRLPRLQEPVRRRKSRAVSGIVGMKPGAVPRNPGRRG
jgi:hypothetical protein